MDAASFAKVLADRFQAVVPAGFHVRADRAMLWFEQDKGVGFCGGSAGSHAVESFFSTTVEEPLEDRATQAAWFALNDLQDYVDEEATEPWPGQRTPPPAHAAVRAGKLHMWFGDEGKADLILGPIDLSPDLQV
jgi:hypothetical protein